MISREQAIDRMIEDAESLGANAITGVRFTKTSMMQSSAETLVYDTVVICENELTGIISHQNFHKFSTDIFRRVMR